jgi:hypothetical protein
MSFGILTLATPSDYRKAIGLALSLRVSNPGVPTAVACSPKVRPFVAPHFDQVIDEDPTLRGFEHKLHLDRYSPFDRTFFFDADVLVFRPLREVHADWAGHAYAACGCHASKPTSPFGLDRERVLKILGKVRFVCIDGAGHAYFEKPACNVIFDLARSIAADYSSYAGNIRLADEDVLDIAMTMLDLEPMSAEGFWSRYCSGQAGTIEMDAAHGLCRYVAVTSGRTEEPYMMHFARNEAPFVHSAQLRRLYRKFRVDGEGLRRLALDNWIEVNVAWPAKRVAKKCLRRLSRPNI